MKTIIDLKAGETGTIKRLHGRGPLKRRFADMGIVKGTDISVIKLAPLGDPIQIQVMDYSLTIRKEDAKDIELE